MKRGRHNYMHLSYDNSSVVCCCLLTTVRATSYSLSGLTSFISILPILLFHFEIYVLDLVGQLIEPELGTVRWIFANFDILMPNRVGTSVEEGYVDLVISLLSN
jgi:hypothetical protein